MESTGSDRMAKGFFAIVDSGINAVAASLTGTPAGAIREERMKEADLLRKELVARLGDGKEAALLLDRFESAIGSRDNIESDFFYAQGMQDGFRLAEILINGALVSWLAAAYPPTRVEEA